MLQRVGLLIGARSDRVNGGTFHSVANFLLRRYGKAIGLEPGFTILDRGDSEDVINLLRTQLADGSWHVRSRAAKFQPYFESGFPHGHDQWISSAGTAWAAIGLAAASGPQPSTPR